MRAILTAAAAACALTLAMPVQADPLDLTEMTETERAAFREEVRSYLLENPEVIFEAIQILEQRRAVAAQAQDRDLVAANAEALYEDPHSWVGGNPEGDVTIVEFIDYRCGYCKRAHPAIQEILDRDPNVRLIVKDFPILGPDSVQTGKLALAAADLDADRFKELNDAMMTYPGNLTEQVAYRLAGEVGYDIAELKSLAASTEIDDRLQRNFQLAQRLGLNGTPAFVVGNEIIRGFLPAEEMLAAVQEARVQQN